MIRKHLGSVMKPAVIVGMAVKMGCSGIIVLQSAAKRVNR